MGYCVRNPGNADPGTDRRSNAFHGGFSRADSAGRGRGKKITSGAEIQKVKPKQEHHYASNKNRTYTPQFNEVAKKYSLNLDDTWNKELLPHQGRHPNAYHEYVLDNMKQFDNIAQGDKDVFMQLYNSMKNHIKSNPDMLYKNYWLKK